MKIKWRRHELILVTLLTAFIALKYLLRMFNGAPFTENIYFYKSILQAQFGILALQYGCYLWLNTGVIGIVRRLFQQKTAFTKTAIPLLVTVSIVAIQVIAIVYLLGPVSNFIAYFAVKDWPDSAIVNIINSVFPPHPQEPYNTFGGFDITLFFVSFYLAYTLFREVAIYQLEKAGGVNQLRIYIVNQVTLFTAIYIAAFPLLPVIDPSHQATLGQTTWVMYLLVVPSIFAVALVNIYWLFPLKGDGSLLQRGIMGKLLLVTGLCAIPVMFLQRAQMVGVWPFFFAGWLFHLVVTTPVSWFIYKERKDKIQQLRGMEAALTRSKADVQFLRSQINPHFLFNVLNTLYGTALQEGSERTAEGIQRLGDMMRFMLHDNTRDFIPMGREIDYLQNYIALQRLRVQSSPNIVINDAVNGDGCNNQIAPMLLIPFVENAFKHGISLREPSFINISLKCDAANIWFSVSNSMHAKQDNDTEKERSGIGIVNVAERLKISYPGKHTIMFNGDGKRFVVELHIQL